MIVFTVVDVQTHFYLCSSLSSLSYTSHLRTIGFEPYFPHRPTELLRRMYRFPHDVICHRKPRDKFQIKFRINSIFEPEIEITILCFRGHSSNRQPQRHYFQNHIHLLRLTFSNMIARQYAWIHFRDAFGHQKRTEFDGLTSSIKLGPKTGPSKVPYLLWSHFITICGKSLPDIVYLLERNERVHLLRFHF